MGEVAFFVTSIWLLPSMTRQSIAVVSPLPAPHGSEPTSGVGQYLVEILERIDDRFDVTVLAGKETEFRTIGHAKVLPTWSPDRRCVPQVLGALRSIRPDVIHLQHEFNLFGGLIPTALLTGAVGTGYFIGRPPVVTIHGVVDRTTVTPEFLAMNHLAVPPSIVRSSLSLAYRSIAMASSRIIVHHDHFKQVLTGSYGINPAKVEVIPHGSHVHLSNHPRRTTRDLDGPIVLVFGFLTGYKLPELVAQLAEEKRVPNAHFRFCVGKNPRINSAGYLARYVNLSDRVKQLGSDATWSGYAPDHELAEIFGSSDIVVLPYTECLSGSGVASLAHSHGVAVCYSRQLRPLFGSSPAEFELNTESLARAITTTWESPGANPAEITSWAITAERNQQVWADTADRR